MRNDPESFQSPSRGLDFLDLEIVLPTNSMNEADNQDELMNSMNQLRLNSNPIQPRDKSSSIQSILRTSDSNSNANPLSGPPSSKRSRIISFSDPISSTGSENHPHHHQSPTRSQSRILRQTPFRRSNDRRDENFDSFKIRKRRASDGDGEDEEIDHIDDDEEEQLNGEKQVEISIPSSPTLPKRTNKRVRIRSPAPIKVNHLNRRVRSRGVRLGGIRRNSLSSVRSGFSFNLFATFVLASLY